MIAMRPMVLAAGLGSEPLAGGNVAPAGVVGRCKSVVDRYEVACPERRCEVFMDLDMCGPGESI